MHAALQATIAADQGARRARKFAEEAATNATRAMSRAEADRDILSGKVVVHDFMSDSSCPY